MMPTERILNQSTLSKLVKCNHGLRTFMHSYKAKQQWHKEDQRKILDKLAETMVSSERKMIASLAYVLGPLVLDLLHRYTMMMSVKETTVEISQEDHAIWLDMHEMFCVTLSTLCELKIPGIKSVVIEYFTHEKNPYMRYAEEKSPTCHMLSRKKRKINISTTLDELLYSVYLLIKECPSLLRLNWSWRELLLFLKGDSELGSLGLLSAHNILAIILHLPEDEPRFLKNFDFQDLSLNILSEVYETTNSESLLLHGNISDEENLKIILMSDIEEKLVSIQGIMLPKSEAGDTKIKKLTITPELQENIRSAAVAISLGHPVLLQGPVGCGKTALVEYLADCTGRSSEIIKVQLGEEVDSKMLIGNYQCTAVPGEFVWRPGALTQAILNGHWILMEDIDKAPLDTISLIIHLVEHGDIEIHGQPHCVGNETVFQSSQFRLFLTRRTHDNTSSSFHIPGFAKLLGHSCVVNMGSFSTSDLKQIVVDKYANLTNVIDKIIAIYTKIEKYTEADKTESEGACRWRSNALHRQLGLRDLLKLCHRVSMRYKSGILDSGIGVLVAMEIVDCFIASTCDSERSNKVALVHRHLSLPSTHDEYFLHKYKPSFHIDEKVLKIGRACLSRNKGLSQRKGNRQMFAHTRHSVLLLESVASAVASCEPVLLVGETGVGKTSVIQYLAQELGHPLHVVNMSQHSSASDLLGGFKPTQTKQIVGPIRDEFERLFSLTFSNEQNKNFMKHIQSCYLHERFHELQSLMSHCSTAAMKKFQIREVEMAQEENQQMTTSWKLLASQIESLRLQLKSQSAAAFTFVEGILAKELKNGGWILLDEINLASAETIECLSSVLESQEGSVVLVEAGDSKPIKRHPDFRLFAAMNPPSDIGKKNLPLSVRNRFLEFYVPEVNDDNDICTLISYYLQQKRVVPTAVVNKVLTFYKYIRKLASTSLVDGTGHKPLYSLRTLCRALRFVSDNPSWPLYKALYEGACLSFLTEIDPSAHVTITNAVISKLIGKENFRSIAKTLMLSPSYPFKTVEGYHIRSGDLSPCEDTNYILTPYVRQNLRILSRAVSYGRYPILIQGETSSGKTSIIKYLAAKTGNVVMRINNHEHTDVQEYVGSYVASDTGKLVFQDGPLVTAMRKGYWIILDELNLASSDVLEALNRVLDDNRELFIAETQETISAHTRFTLFATQNPVGVYGGRKTLSRALRNRFIELHFGEIPVDEIKSILHERSLLPMSRCCKLVKVMQDLRIYRKKSGIFSGKHGFITLRDLFKWAERARRDQEYVETDMYDLDQSLANDGYLLLAGRVRNSEEESIIREIIEKHLGRKIVPEEIFSREATLRILGDKCHDSFKHIVLTKSMRRMCVTAQRAMLFGEPILLVGETGCGKTSVCQLLTHQGVLSKACDLVVINCHSHTDASDFIGGLRPIRHDDTNVNDNKLFEWMDGPLVNAMIAGSSFLVDEISLAQDSVLERLNSVLETERTLVVPEKSCSDKAVGIDSMVIMANEGFNFMATMNPGGDYGKKELSPALRNRFTEIWCSLTEDRDSDFEEIIKHNLTVKLPYLDFFPKMIVQFVNWFISRSFGSRYVKSIRDIWKWIKFLNASVPGAIDTGMAYVHGALLVYIDGIGSDLSGDFSSQAVEVKNTCLEYVANQLKIFGLWDYMSADGRLNLKNLLIGNDRLHSAMDLGGLSSTHFGIKPFYIACGPKLSQNPSNYSFHAPTTSKNLLRLLRGLQLPEPILLEGAPGIGKTSLVQSLAEASGHYFIRINLSEQTDISDLIGADMPVEDAGGGRFQWRDGPVLAGLKAGSWILFDELNLASQSVLEGLNSVFDHRSSIFIPELGKTFNVDSNGTRFFACQNPLQQGGGRKGLPKSFLNRFNQVYMESLSCVDMTFILSGRFPDIPQSTISQMVLLNQKVNDEIVHNSNWAHAGSPWDFNLRDLTRWCQLMYNTKNAAEFDPGSSFYLVYCERLQSLEDRQKMCELFCEIFPEVFLYWPSKAFHITPKLIQVGNALMSRIGLSSIEKCQSLQLLPSMLHPIESVINILNKGWMCILSGHSHSGKTSLVSSLAALTGHKLSTVSVNSCTDTTDLVGGFEQLDVFRSLYKVVEKLSDLITVQLRDVLCDCSTNSAGFSLAIKYSKVFHEFHSYKTALRNSSDGQAAIKTAHSLCTLVKKLLALLNSIGADEHIINQIKACHNQAIKLHGKLQSNTRGCHEWVDSTLVNCLRKGEWLVIDDANLCSPSVLDRLNSLLEPNGTLTVTERGVINGNIEEIRPHPSFRLILCLDSLHGNLSRAMRNRGVEVHLLSSLSETPENINPQSHMTWDEIEEIMRFKLSRLYMLHSSVISSIAKGILRACQDADRSEKTLITSSEMMNAVGIAERICNDLSFHVFSPSSVLAVCQEHLNGNPRTHEICQAIEDSLKSSPDSRFQLPRGSIADLALNSTISQVYHQSRFLDELQSSALLEKHSRADLLTVGIHFLIKLSSRRDFKLRIYLLSEFIARNDLSQHDIDHTEKQFLGKLLQNIIFKDKSLMMLESNMDKFMPHEYKEEFHSVSWDPRWYGQLMNAMGVSLSEENEDILDLISVIYDIQLYFFEDKKISDALIIKTGNDLQENNFKNVENHGPLILSSLYHNGTVPLDHLQHPAVAHLYPLFEKLETFIMKHLKQCQNCKFDDDAQKNVANMIFEISFLRRKMMKHGCFDVVDFFVCVRNLQSCVRNFSRVLPFPNTTNELFQIVNKHFDNIKALLEVVSDESNVEMQKQIRNSVMRKMPQVKLYQNSDQVTLLKFVQYLIKATIKSSKNFAEEANSEFLTLLNDHLLNLCKLLVDLKICETTDSNIVLMRTCSFVTDDDQDVGEFTDMREKLSAMTMSLQELFTKLNRSIDFDRKVFEKSGIPLQQQSLDLVLEYTEQDGRDERCPASFFALSTSFTLMEISSTLRLVIGGLQNAHGLLKFIVPSIQTILEFLMSHCSINPRIIISAKSLLTLAQRSNIASCIDNYSFLSYALDIINSNFHCYNGPGTVNHLQSLFLLHKPVISRASLNIIYNDGMESLPNYFQHTDGKFNNNSSLLQLSSEWLYDHLSIPVKDREKKIMELKVLQEMLWINSSLHEMPQAKVLESECQKTPRLIPSQVVLLLQYFMNQLLLFESKKGNFLHMLLDDDLLENLQELKIHMIEFSMDLEHDQENTATFLLLKEILAQISLVITNYDNRLSDFYISESSWIETLQEHLRFSSQHMTRLIANVHLQQYEADCDEIFLENLGKCWIWLGSFCLLLFSPQHVVDPVHYLQSKFECQQYQVSKLECEVEVYRAYHKKMTGEVLDFENESTFAGKRLHPRMLLCFQNLEAREQKMIRTNSKLCVRSSDQFKKLRRIAKQFTASISSPDSLHNIFKIFDSAMTKNQDASMQQQKFLSVGNKIETGIVEFISELDNYIDFQDYIAPMMDALNAINIGLKVACQLIEAVRGFGLEQLTMERFFVNMMTCSEHHASSSSMITFAKAFQKYYDGTFPCSCPSSIYEKTLATLLLQYRNRVHFQGVTSLDYSDVHFLVDTVFKIWQKEEDDKMMEEKTSLYKPQVHADETSEEEVDEQEFQKAFPQFYENMSDLMQESQEQEQASQSHSKKFHQWEYLYKLAIALHREMIQESLDTTDISDASDETQEELPLLFGHLQFSSDFQNCYPKFINEETDALMQASHLIVCKRLRQYLTGDDGERVPTNVYRDSWPQESNKCLLVLRDISTCITQSLLVKCPDNPTLMTILQIIGKILAIDAGAPLIKLITAVEILITNMQLWEKNASSSLSLFAYIDQLMKMDAQWRKTEIKCWDTLLNDTLKNITIDHSMYIRVYHLILNSVEEDNMLGLVEALCQFIGVSTLAEFTSRLKIINIFFKQLFLFGNEQNLLMTILWNVYHYYSQFSITISAKVEEFRKQTEKKITDVRKICEWNTMNAFAKKDVIIRSQRSIFSELKKFSKIVGQEVTSFFHLTEDNTIGCEDLNAEKMVKNYLERSCDHEHCLFSGVIQEKLEMLVQYIRRHMYVSVKLSERLLSFAPLVVRLPHVTKKLFRFCLEWTITNKQGFWEQIPHLDRFIDELSSFIETKKCNNLAEAKAGRVQKRSSLNNLFKSLKSIGLSYQKGNVLARELNLGEFFLTPFCYKSALDLKCDANDLWTNRHMLVKQTDNCFYRNIIEWFSLSNFMSAPHKDINRITLDRIRGYIGEIITMSLKQHTWISAFGNAEIELDQFLLSLSAFGDSELVLPQQTCSFLIQESRKVVNDWIVSLSKFMAWLECCPKSDNECDHSNAFLPHITTPIPEEKLPLYAKMRYGDETWKQSMNDAKALFSISNDLKRILDAEPKNVFLSKQGPLTLEDKMRNISNLVSRTCSSAVKFCDSLTCLFMNPVSQSTNNISPCAADILRYKMKLELLEESFQEILCDGSTEQVINKGNPVVSKLLLAANELVSSVLINVQVLKKISTYTAAELKRCEIESEMVEEKILMELHNTMEMHYKSLKIDLTLISFQRFFQTIRELSEVKGVKIPGLIFSILKPAVERFHNVIIVINISLEKMHHTTCKLGTRLSSIFLDVLANGFGSLKEYEEQENKSDNDMKMEDIDEGGIGDGKGETNVSDQIEDEQFDDLQEDNNPVDKEQGDQNDEDAVETFNDFEGNFDDAEEEKDSEQEEDDNKSDISDQMGETQMNAGNDELDKCLWGDDGSEQDQIDNENDEVKNSSDNKESELAAKSESLSKEEYSEEQEQEDENEQSKDDLNVDEVKKDISCENVDFNEEESKELDQEAHTDIDGESPNDEKEKENDISEELDFEAMDESMDDEEMPDEVETGEDVGYVSDEDDQNGISDEVESREEVDVSDDKNQDNTAMTNANPEQSQKMENPEVECGVWGDEDHGEDSRNPNKNESDLQEEEGDNKGPRMRSQSNTKTKDADSVSSTSAPEVAKRSDLNDVLKREKIARNVDHNDQEDNDDVIEKHLNVVDPAHGGKEENNDNEVTDKSDKQESDLYQITNNELRYDKKTLDSSVKEEVVGNDIKSDQDIEKSLQEDSKCDMSEVSTTDNKEGSADPSQVESYQEAAAEMEIDEENELTNTIDERSKNEKLSGDNLQLTSTIHTSISCFKQLEPVEIEKIRLALEEKLLHWSHNFSGIEIRDAELTWQKIRNLTQPISLQLCEQLRLILEPTKAAQLKGDYRSGKRLNMRKVIPYIASGFRKDKIWLRRLKPSKRLYQIMLAIDDSSSMLDNHSKELAFESVSVISNALTTLEAGQLALCNFGETTKILHSFDDQFTDRSGAAVIAQCSFLQKKTLLAKFLQQSITILQDAQRNSVSGGPHPDIAQLLLIISDGRGLYQEGKDVVVRAVHAAQGARIFIVFVIIDQTPDKHSSILNIKVPMFKGPNEVPEITSYLDDFPFPFYLILRNINDLPHTLGDALRQWFEMVVGSE